MVQTENVVKLDYPICLPRFSPPIYQFTDNILPVCLPEFEDEDRLPVGTLCYTTGNNCTYIQPNPKSPCSCNDIGKGSLRAGKCNLVGDIISYITF